MIFTGIFLISAAILALQLLQTRLFSFTLWHHLAYMVITIGLMGMSASGTYLTMRRKKIEQPWRFLALSSLLFSITTFISLAVVTRIPLDTYMVDKARQLSYIFLYYMVLILPYFFAGIVISFVFKHIKEKINIYYLSNLIGSAIGGYIILGFSEMLGGEGAIYVICLMGLVSAVLFALVGNDRKVVGATVVSAALLLSLFPLRTDLFTVTSPPSKALGQGYMMDKKTSLEYTYWNRVSRIDVFDNPHTQIFFNYFPDLENKIITIDGDAYTVLYNFPSAIEKHKKEFPDSFNDPKDYYKHYPPIGYSLYSSAYFIHENPEVLIVGLGGGTDIITALYHDPKSVTGVEINSSMIEVTKETHADFIGKPYQDPRVKIVHSEGRSYIRRVEEKFDIIQMSGVDTWTALSTGAYVMSESYIYTTDAVREYLSKLKPDGTLSIIRWLFWPPREMLRLCTEAVKVLREMGIEHPEKHIAIIGDGSLASILVKLRPFTAAEIAALDKKTRFSRDAKYPSQIGMRADGTPRLLPIYRTKAKRIIYAPGFTEKETYYKPIFTNWFGKEAVKGFEWLNNSFLRFFKLVENGEEISFIENYDYNIAPVSDDNPFFFRYYKWKHLLQAGWGSGGPLVDAMPIGLIILMSSLLQALLFSLLLIVVPLFFLRRKEKVESPASQITYFSMLGMGFMFIEIAIIQHFVLFLGNPSEAIAITIMILLCSAGIGSLKSRDFREKLGVNKIYGIMRFLAPIVIICYAFLIPWFTHLFLSTPFALRVIISFILLSPLGFMLGQFFPIGLHIVGEKNEAFIPWAFATNGLFSVISSVLSIIFAMIFGFTAVFLFASLCYLLAMVVFHRFSSKECRE